MKTKIELINDHYYDVTYDENEVAVLMILIGNHDDMLSKINFRLKKKSDEIISLKEELKSKEFVKKVRFLERSLQDNSLEDFNCKLKSTMCSTNLKQKNTTDFSTCFEECESSSLEVLKCKFPFIFKEFSFIFKD